MQQNQVLQEEQYADGLGEYASFYGGASYNYHTPAKLASPTIHELPASQPAVAEYDRQSTTANLQHAISYDLAANVPQIRKEAEGLQLASLDRGIQKRQKARSWLTSIQTPVTPPSFLKKAQWMLDTDTLAWAMYSHQQSQNHSNLVRNHTEQMHMSINFLSLPPHLHRNSIFILYIGIQYNNYHRQYHLSLSH
jgi:hypothetical protein